MPKKTTKVALAAIQQYERLAKHVTEVLQNKEAIPLENQPYWMKDRPPIYWVGVACGAMAMCEAVLHQQGCYHGFSYLDKEFKILVNPGNPITEHPEYADWRVYFGAK